MSKRKALFFDIDGTLLSEVTKTDSGERKEKQFPLRALWGIWYISIPDALMEKLIRSAILPR